MNDSSAIHSVLVLGATGNVGSALVKRLHARSVAVRGLFNPEYDQDAVIPDYVDAFPGTFDDRDLLRTAMTGVDAVFVLTPPSPKQPEWYTNIVAAATTAKVRRIVKLSAFTSHPESNLHLCRWHAEGEAAIRTAGLEYTFLQPQYFMQTQTQAIRTALGSGVMRGVAAADLRMGFVDVRDIADVAAVALLEGGFLGRTLVPTGPAAPSFDEIAGMVEAATGKPVRYEAVPADMLRTIAPFSHMPDWLWEDFLLMHSIDASDLVTDDVLQITGRQPRRYDNFVRDLARG